MVSRSAEKNASRASLSRFQTRSGDGLAALTEQRVRQSLGTVSGASRKLHRSNPIRERRIGSYRTDRHETVRADCPAVIVAGAVVVDGDEQVTPPPPLPRDRRDLCFVGAPVKAVVPTTCTEPSALMSLETVKVFATVIFGRPVPDRTVDAAAATRHHGSRVDHSIRRRADSCSSVAFLSFRSCSVAYHLSSTSPQSLIYLILCENLYLYS